MQVLARAEALNREAHQHRAVQRRLLTRLRDKTPAPLHQLAALLDFAQARVVAAARAVEEAQRTREVAATGLGCVAQLLALLLELRCRLSRQDAALLQGCLAVDPPDPDPCAPGWEETCDAACAHLLRVLGNKPPEPQPLAMARDSARLQRHLTALCDKLLKGSSIAHPLPLKSLTH